MSTKRQIFLTTKHLNLVMIKPSDTEEILDWYRDPEVNQYLSGGYFPIATSEHKKKRITNMYKKPLCLS